MASKSRSTFPMYRSRLGLNLGQAEAWMGQPAVKIRQWIADGLITPAHDGSIPTHELTRFRREHSDLLA